MKHPMYTFEDLLVYLPEVQKLLQFQVHVVVSEEAGIDAAPVLLRCNGALVPGHKQAEWIGVSEQRLEEAGDTAAKIAVSRIKVP